jgi:hypothetical protein
LSVNWNGLIEGEGRREEEKENLEEGKNYFIVRINSTLGSYRMFLGLGFSYHA